MHRFHFVHAAGLRLDEPFRGVGRVPSNVRASLSEAGLAAWDDLVEFCIRKEAAFLVIAGGVFSGDAGSLIARSRLRRGVKRLSDQGIRTLLALSAADGDLGDLFQDLRAGEVTVFPRKRPLVVRFEHKGETIALLAGQSAPAEAEIDSSEFFPSAGEEFVRIGVLPIAGDQLERQPEQVRRSATYWALGGAIDPSRRGFSPWIVDSGALQARENRKGERTAYGAMLVSVDGNRVVAVDHAPLDRVRYARVAIAPKHALDAPLLVHQVLDELNRLRAAHSGRALLVDIVLQGVPAAQAAPPDRLQVNALLDHIRRDTSAWDPFVWCSSLCVDSVVAGGDHKDDPVARAILQEAQTLIANPLQRSYAFARHFEPLMRRCTSELDSGDAERLIAEATVLALRQAGDDAPA